MSDTIDKRLEIVQNRITQYGMRFPVANIAGRIKFDRGYISAVLNGKKPMSDNFWSKFDQAFPDKTSGKPIPEIQQMDMNGSPPAYIPVSWQDYIKLIHFSLEALKGGQNEILMQQAKTRAEVRGYGKYHLVKDAKGNRERFDKLLAEVDKLVNDEISDGSAQDNASGS